MNDFLRFALLCSALLCVPLLRGAPAGAAEPGPETDSTDSTKVSNKEEASRRSRYLKEHATLTKQAYTQLFGGPCNQRNTRDCYILAAIGAIPLSQREALFRTSITREEDGFEIRFPMGVSDAQDSVHVSNRDLGPQVVIVNGKRVAYQPVNTTPGWKALEAAYILLAYGRDANGQVNRQAAAYGDPVVVAERMVNTKRSARIVIGNGKNPLAGLPPNDLAAVRRIFDSFDPNRQMLMLGSLETSMREFVVDGIKFNKQHAYVAYAVDPKKQSVTLVNPHDSTRPLVISYGTLAKAFRVVRRLEFDAQSTYGKRGPPKIGPPALL
jgi:hypothetical protein